jgi:orotidine-5'-phosphate decarboxylase
MSKPSLGFSLSVEAFDADLTLLQALRPQITWCSVGPDLLLHRGPSVIRQLVDLNFNVLLDLNLHHIPSVLDALVASFARLGAKLLTISAQSGPRSLEAAFARASREATDLRLAACTVLTSVCDEDLLASGTSNSTADLTLRLARQAHCLGYRAFLCSPLESAAIRQQLGPASFIITPGIRSLSQDIDDHQRVSSPFAAVRSSSNLLLIGRPVRQTQKPLQALRDILAQIDDAFDRPDC